jgi:hypothetical protein
VCRALGLTKLEFIFLTSPEISRSSTKNHISTMSEGGTKVKADDCAAPLRAAPRGDQERRAQAQGGPASPHSTNDTPHGSSLRKGISGEPGTRSGRMLRRAGHSSVGGKAVALPG